ncbi:MAG TPA: Ig-like domain-containing protein, partial [Symbiobacteriaceae bacterium]|nr:Ig-like domain-containing protein [Symbiobacteriaceae bacterium]
VPGHVTFSGTLASGKAEHSFSVNDTAYPLAVTLIMPGWSGSNSPDFDLYVFNPDGTELGRSSGTSRQETVAKRITQVGIYKLEIRAYGGNGEYVADVSAGLGTASDQPPAVSIDEPADGATVSGNTTVKVRATDGGSISKVELAVDNGAYTDITGSFDGTHYTYAWDTTGAANGPHTLTARALDNANQTGSATRSVTVSNQSPEPGLVNLLEKTGRVTAGARDANFTINVHERGYVDVALSWGGRADLDFYVYGPDGTQIGRAYTLNNPERLRVDTVRYGTGAYQVRVNLYEGPDSSFTLTARGFKEETYQGAVTPASKDSTHQRAMAYTGRGRASLQWTGTSDIDFYLYDQVGRERGKAFTLNNPEVLDTGIDATGTWSIRVNLYSGAGGQYTLKWTVPEAVLS